ncbi:MAG: M1 family aminopeptidase [Acidobacteriaceae bacterium]
MQFQKFTRRTGNAIATLTLLSCVTLLAQQSTQTAPAPAQTDQAQPVPHGKVLFSRSLDTQSIDTPDTTPEQPAQPALAHRPVPAKPTAGVEKPAVTVTNVERGALTFTAYDLDIRLTPADSSLAVRAEITVRNDGPQPLLYLPLQISSTLTWESVRMARGHEDGGKELVFAQQTVDSDVDHTGQVQEAVVTLTRPLAPQASLTLDVIYAGQIPLNAERLERIGAPPDVAQGSDWDRISPGFTGLRGFGNVLWYPVASEVLRLGDGAKLFEGVGRWKQRQENATIRMRVQVVYDGDAPTLAVLDGKVIPLSAPADPTVTGISSSSDTGSTSGNAAVSSSSSSTSAAQTAAPPHTEPATAAAFGPPIPHVVRFDLATMPLGFRVPSLFVLTRSLVEGQGVDVYAVPSNAVSAQAYAAAASLVQPFFKQWFGSHQPRSLAIIDLPEPSDQPYETGDVVFLPLRDVQSSALTPLLSHEMAHAWFRSSRPWMDEGMAQFMGLLWLEHTSGRDAAIQAMAQRRDALALAEPATPGKGAGQSLIAARDDIYYRTKAAYVWWMLRDMVNDKALRTALQQYQPEADTEPDYFEHLLEKASGKDLKWFFDDWVYNDKGLPDLSITSVVPRLLEKNQYLVAVEVANAGDAAAEVPVTVHAGVNSATERLLVNAHARASTRVLIQGAPGEVLVNDGSVPESRASIHRSEIAIPNRN